MIISSKNINNKRYKNICHFNHCWGRVESKIYWNKINSVKQNRIRKNNERENSKRIDHNFQKGDWATLTRPGSIDRTLANSSMGPYKVVKQHDNGSITIQMTPFKTKNVNRHRLQPYQRRTNDELTINDDKQSDNNI